MSHTPEPWFWRIKHKTQRTISAPPRGDIAVCPGDDPIASANASRIVACVNACAGIPTETLEEVGADFAKAALDNGATAMVAHRLTAERDALRERVDELLNLARGADHLFRGEKYYSEFRGDDQVALWRKAYATLAQTAETEGR